MAGPIFTGEAATRLPDAWAWDPRRGKQLIVTWWGRYDELAALADSAALDGRPVSMEPQTDHSWVLRITYGGDTDQPVDEALADYWERDSNDPEKSVWLIPKVVTAMNTITDFAARSALKKVVESFVAGDVEYSGANGLVNISTLTAVRDVATAAGMTPDDWDKWDKTTTPPTGTGVIRALIYDMQKGTDSWPVSGYVLRRTVIVAPNAGSALKPVDSNNNKILTTAQLTTLESLPAALKFNVPDGYWLRRTPRIAQQSNNRWQIIYEFWHADEYSSLIYWRAS